MKLKFSLRRQGAEPVDLTAVLDTTTSVGDLAAALAAKDPRRPAGAGTTRWTLDLIGQDRVNLDPGAAVSDSGLFSGATLALAPFEGRFRDPTAAPAAVARVVEGPDRGREFRLDRGTSMIGRSASCEVRITDPSVSREHAKLHITDEAEVVDLGSANGITVEDGQVARAKLRPGDRIGLGDTVLVVEVTRGAAAASGSSVLFNRSPRLDPDYMGREFLVPSPPQKHRNSRLPVIAMIAPLIFGAILFAITRSPTSLVFVALSPVMALGNALESRISGKRGYKAGLIEWRAALANLSAEIAVAGEAEGRRRRLEHPAGDEVVGAIAHREALLWSRRPDVAKYLELRLGLGPMESRSTITLPDLRELDKAIIEETQQVAAAGAYVPAVPVVGHLADSPIGFAGAREVCLGLASSAIVQLVGLHSPAELVMAAALATDEIADWDWLKWLPHSSSPHSPITGQHLAANPASVTLLIAELESLVDTRLVDKKLSPSVVLLVEDVSTTDRARLVNLAEKGATAGLFVIWVAPKLSMLPAACRTYVVASVDGVAVGFVGRGELVPLQPADSVDSKTCAVLARQLSPLVDSGAPLEDDSDIPRSIAWLGLNDKNIDGPSAIIEQWKASRSIMTGPEASPPSRRKPGSLRAIIGQSASGVHSLDLRKDGPHALVGGTTGSGKSELLQSWILGMAATHSPQRVTFLLVDYKGGSAFQQCAELPHTVGLVTDLSPHLVRRALTSLSAELKWREGLLAANKKKDLLDMEEAGMSETPPSLVIVVDEFAALVHEVPEFVDGVVNVAQRGRSLGLHLILATQRPAGVIKDNLRANTNLRLALRVSDEADSTDVLGSPQAAWFDQGTPGRAMSKTGPGRLVPFQAAYAGGWTTNEPAKVVVEIDELTLGIGRRWEEPEVTAEVVVDPGPTDIQRVVGMINAAHEQASLPAPRQPWLHELAAEYELEEIAETPATDTKIAYGVSDLPQDQEQPTIYFRPDVEGNLAVYGTGGSGKSGLLRTLAISAGFSALEYPCHVYGIDFGGRGLHMLEQLPHVGSIIPSSDHERIARLIGDLRALIDERAARYAAMRTSTITDYRKQSGRRAEARILLLVDGIGAFRSGYESTDRLRLFETFLSIAADGRPVGVHVILSADRPGAVPTALAATVQRRVVLRLVDEGDYSTLGEPADVLVAGVGPGRGLTDNIELQVGVLGGSSNMLTQTEAVHDLAQELLAGGVLAAAPVRKLPVMVPLTDLPPLLEDAPVLGMSAATLAPVSIPRQGCLLVTGPLGSGRTTTLESMAQSLRRWRPDIQLHYIGQSRSRLASLALWATVSISAEQAAETAKSLTVELAEEQPVGTMAVFVEGVPEFLNGTADAPLQALVKALTAADQLFVAEGEVSTMGPMSGLMGLIKSGRSGIALQPESSDGNVFKSEFPRARRVDFPEGRGFFVHRGRSTVVQVGFPVPLRPEGGVLPIPDP